MIPRVRLLLCLLLSISGLVYANLPKRSQIRRCSQLASSNSVVFSFWAFGRAYLMGKVCGQCSWTCQFSTWVRPGKRTPPSIKFPLGNSGKSYFSGDLVGSVFRGQAKWQIASWTVLMWCESFSETTVTTENSQRIPEDSSGQPKALTQS